MSGFLNELTINQYGKIRFAKEFAFQKTVDIDITRKIIKFGSWMRRLTAIWEIRQ